MVFFRGISSVALVCLLLLAGSGIARAGDTPQLEVLLIWGTNQEKSSDPAHKQVSPETAKDFKKVYKWTNYFVINRKNSAIDSKKKTSIKMSDHCRIEVKYLGDDRYEICLWGKDVKTGKEEAVVSGKQTLPKGEKILLMGLNENESGWFVLVRHKK